MIFGGMSKFMTKILEDYFTEIELCKELGVKPRTTKQWRLDREGPAVTYLRGTPLYRKVAVKEWLLAREGKSYLKTIKRG